MIVSIVGSSCFVYREPGDPKFRPNKSKSSWSPPGWYGAESRLLYNVQKILNTRGYDLLKKRMWRDGHMFGSNYSQYLKSRDIKKTPSLYLYHGSYCTEVAAEFWNVLGRVELDVVYGAALEDESKFEHACREWVAERELTHSCYEVSWESEATIDGQIATRRLYRGFQDLREATVCLTTEPGDSCRLINRRTGKPVLAACVV